MNRAASLFLFLALAGCGYVGDTKPPTADIPSRVTDLRAAEYGDRIRVAFTIPMLTTEGLALKSVQSVELRARAGPETQSYAVPASGPGPVNFEFPAQMWIGKTVTLDARATGPKGKVSEFSNAATIPVGPPIATPVNVKAGNAPGAVELAWQGAGPRYRVYRAAGDGAPQQIGESDQPAFMDNSIAYGTAYRYYVQALDGALRQSEVSAPLEFMPQDVFPPSVPSGLSAASTANSIELAWVRNTEGDFAGYNVYRAVDAGEFEMIAGMVRIPVYSDRQVEAGKRYRYAVTAVDTAGNESARSEIAEAVAQ